MIAFIRPCSPVTARKVPAGDDWVHETKLDGYRFQIIKAGRQVQLYGGSGSEWTKRLPGLADALLEKRRQHARSLFALS